MLDKPTDRDWRRRGLCKYEDPELFFPVGKGAGSDDQVDEAKAVCRRCPVATTCLEWAVSTGQDAGIWGGLDEDERRNLKRRDARRRQREQTLAKPLPITAADEAVA